MYNTRDVANWFIERRLDAGLECTQVHVNTLVYIAHGWHLAVFPDGDGLISDPVFTWKYGPIIPTLRQDLRSSGGAPITECISVYLARGQRYEPKLQFAKMPEPERKLLEWVWLEYGRLSANKLIGVTLRSTNAWYAVTSGRYLGRCELIPNDIIRKCYCRLLKQIIEPEEKDVGNMAKTDSI